MLLSEKCDEGCIYAVLSGMTHHQCHGTCIALGDEGKPELEDITANQKGTTMANVKRYDLKQEGDYSQREGVMTEVSNGDWVYADDYDTLQEEATRLRNIIKDALENVMDARSNLTDA
jgi:hypothetical protein